MFIQNEDIIFAIFTDQLMLLLLGKVLSQFYPPTIGTSVFTSDTVIFRFP